MGFASTAAKIEHILGAIFHRARPSGLARPDPDRPEGADCLPQIHHIVILMMENHSFDNYLGTLGRGDGFTLDAQGQPTDSNPTKAGQSVRAHHLPTTQQVPHIPTQSWPASHEQYAGGRNDGFVTSIEDSGFPGDPHLAMGYWDGRDLPFYSALAGTFPLCDRWFGSCLGPTIPNRRFLISGTANGLTTDALTELLDDAPNGTILDSLSRHGISWANYHDSDELNLLSFRFSRLRSKLQSMVQFTADVYPASLWRYLCHVRSLAHFYRHCAEGSLPSVSLVDPNYDETSEENPQDIRKGEAFAAKVINAVLASPAWPNTLLIWTYDEHGGYYDHVPPPAAPAPDGVAPRTDPQGHFDRLGFRVPAVLVSPYARPDYVSSVVHDHTSVLKLIETKWNLPALTNRDAAADNLLDSLDFSSPPAFARPPSLPPPALALP